MPSQVVNCSQKLISLIFGTTKFSRGVTLRGCELLSKVDIFDIRNNVSFSLVSSNSVVNCSQKLISLIFGTTALSIASAKLVLWIALKSWYLWYSEQLKQIQQRSKFSCELLSKVDIFDIRNNTGVHATQGLKVVNCSQKLISLIFGTTE